MLWNVLIRTPPFSKVYPKHVMPKIRFDRRDYRTAPQEVSAFSARQKWVRTFNLAGIIFSPIGINQANFKLSEYIKRLTSFVIRRMKASVAGHLQIGSPTGRYLYLLPNPIFTRYAVTVRNKTMID
jgi:hypothetical protein